MSPEEERYRDMWLAEMWPTVYEYVPGSKPTPHPVQKAEEKPGTRAA